MVEIIEDEIFYHVTTQSDYNQHPPLQVGDEFEIGGRSNIFFGFYEGSRTYRANVNGEDKQIKAIGYLEAFQKGILTNSDQNHLPSVAVDIAKHYLMLVRELIMEEVRREIIPDAPSRQTCLWVSRTREESEFWAAKIAKECQIARLKLSGKIYTVDAGFLLADSEPLSVTYNRARSYWNGEVHSRPEPETLFEGRVVVEELISFEG